MASIEFGENGLLYGALSVQFDLRALIRPLSVLIRSLSDLYPKVGKNNTKVGKIVHIKD